MTLDTFFKKFDQFADAPDAVAKMRELVLELAIQGKLVEPPSKPETDRAWLAFKKEISERIYGYDPGSTPPFDIPEHWEWSVLGEVAKPCGQKTPDENFTYIDVGSIDNARGELKPDLNTIEPAHAPSRARKLAKLGSVIYATVRPYLKNIAVIEREFSPPAIISTAFAILHPLPFVESRFLFYWLRSSAFEREVSAYAKGVAYPAISDGDLKGCVIPVPPPSEQKRIVAKVDELMALCDRLEAQQQERDEQASALARASLARFAEAPTPANLNLLFHKSYSISPADLRKAILTLAVQGKLVTRCPLPPPSDELKVAKRKLSEKEGIRNRAEVVRLDRAEWGHPIPEHWDFPNFDDLLVIVSGVTKGRVLAGRKTETVPYLRVANVQRGYLDLNVIKEIEVLQEDENRYRLESGDVLMTEGGDWDKVGRAAVWRSKIDRCIHQNHVYRIRSPRKELLLPEWVECYVNSPVGRSFFEAASKQTTNLASINMTQLRGCPLPLPPSEEQRRIVAKVDQLMALVDQLETQLAASRATAKNLLEAFVSELSSDLIM